MDIATSSFLDELELEAMGFASVGQGCLVSRFARFYGCPAIHIGDNSRIDDFCVISASDTVRIGRHVHIAPFSLIAGRSGVVLEDFSGLASRVAIYSESDDLSGHSLTNPTVLETFKPRYHKGPVHIGRHVIIGTASTVLPRSILPEGCALNAHSLFMGTADKWTIYAGNPAKAIRQRAPDILALEECFLTTTDIASRRTNEDQ